MPKVTNGLNLQNTQKITNLLDPTAAQDAATKNYVDTHSSVYGFYFVSSTETVIVPINRLCMIQRQTKIDGRVTLDGILASYA